VTVKAFGQCEDRDSSGFERVEGHDSRGTMMWIQEDTEQDCSQTEYGKNALAEGIRGHQRASGTAKDLLPAGHPQISVKSVW
jgi:hypothetical protein